MAASRKGSNVTIEVAPLTGGATRLRIKGRTPLILNRMPEKARLTLLVGGGARKSKGSGKLKHDPYQEFVSAMQLAPGLYKGTDIVFPAVAFKNAMGTAAIYSDTVNKTDIKRLVYVPEEWVPVYGVPRMRLDVMRQAGMARTPDIRTRAVIHEWETEFKVEYLPPLSASALAVLLANAGIMCGIGDSRQELGKGSFGTFTLAKGAVKKSLKNVEAQRQAIANPRPREGDVQSEDLLRMFRDEVAKRQ